MQISLITYEDDFQKVDRNILYLVNIVCTLRYVIRLENVSYNYMLHVTLKFYGLMKKMFSEDAA